MYILIIFQFSICVLAGIGLNHYFNIEKMDKTKNIYKVIGSILSLSGILFLLKQHLL